MSAQNQFKEGLDPTALTSVSASQLLQMIREAKPEAYVGYLYVGTSAPDIINNTFYTRYLWLDTTTPSSPTLKFYNSGTGTWVAYSPGFGSLSGTVLTDGTVLPVKINVAGGTPGYMLVVNSGGTALIYKDPTTIFGSNTFPIDNLVHGSNGTFLKSVTGLGCEWRTLTTSDILAAFNNNKIQVPLLDGTGASDGQVVTFDAGLGYYTPKTPVAPTLVNNPTIPEMVVFNASTTWTVPANKTRIRIKVWGAGGGGDTYAGGGGGYTERCVAVTAGDSLIVTVGAGGTSNVGATPATDGADSSVQTSSFVLLANALGGKSGKDIAGYRGEGAAAVTSDGTFIALAGGCGSRWMSDGSNNIGGPGGSSPQGGQGGPNINWTGITDKNGRSPGGGGTGRTSTSSIDGGNGANGMVVIEY